jgi:hypothetical protein
MQWKIGKNTEMPINLKEMENTDLIKKIENPGKNGLLKISSNSTKSIKKNWLKKWKIWTRRKSN